MSVSASTWVCFLIGLTGLLVFVAALTVLSLNPDRVEAHMQRFVVNEVEKGTRQALNETETVSRTKNAMQRLASKFDDKGYKLQQIVAEKVPLIVATILADRCKGDCPDAERLEDIALKAVLGSAMNLEIRSATLRDFVNDRYDRTIEGMLTDLKVFCYVNALAFALILLLSSVRGKTLARPLLKLSLMIATSVLVSCYFYLFGQDWFSTILLNDFVGWAYLIWMVMLLGLLVDIGFMRATITQFIANAIGAFFSHLSV